MSDTPTPLTDELARKFANPNKMIEHAKKLERALTERDRLLREAREDLQCFVDVTYNGKSTFDLIERIDALLQPEQNADK